MAANARNTSDALRKTPGSGDTNNNNKNFRTTDQNDSNISNSDETIRNTSGGVIGNDINTTNTVDSNISIDSRVGILLSQQKQQQPSARALASKHLHQQNQTTDTDENSQRMSKILASSTSMLASDGYLGGISSDSELTSSLHHHHSHHHRPYQHSRPYSSQSHVYHAHPAPRGSHPSSRMSHYSDSATGAYSSTSNPAGPSSRDPVSATGTMAPSSQSMAMLGHHQQVSSFGGLGQHPAPGGPTLAHQMSLSSSGSGGSGGQNYLAGGSVESSLSSQHRPHQKQLTGPSSAGLAGSGRKLPTRPFKHSMSIDHHSLYHFGGDPSGSGLSSPVTGNSPQQQHHHHNRQQQLAGTYHKAQAMPVGTNYQLVPGGTGVFPAAEPPMASPLGPSGRPHSQSLSSSRQVSSGGPSPIMGLDQGYPVSSRQAISRYELDELERQTASMGLYDPSTPPAGRRLPSSPADQLVHQQHLQRLHQDSDPGSSQVASAGSPDWLPPVGPPGAAASSSTGGAKLAGSHHHSPFKHAMSTDNQKQQQSQQWQHQYHQHHAQHQLANQQHPGLVGAGAAPQSGAPPSAGLVSVQAGQHPHYSPVRHLREYYSLASDFEQQQVLGEHQSGGNLADHQLHQSESSGVPRLMHSSSPSSGYLSYRQQSTPTTGGLYAPSQQQQGQLLEQTGNFVSDPMVGVGGADQHRNLGTHIRQQQSRQQSANEGKSQRQLPHQMSSSSSSGGNNSQSGSLKSINDSSAHHQHHQSKNLPPLAQHFGPGLSSSSSPQHSYHHHHHHHQPYHHQQQQHYQHQPTRHALLSKGYTYALAGGSGGGLSSSLATGGSGGDLSTGSPVGGGRPPIIGGGGGSHGNRAARAALRASSPSTATLDGGGSPSSSSSAATGAVTYGGAPQHHQHQHGAHAKNAAASIDVTTRSETSTGLPNGPINNSNLTKKSNSATQLSMTGTKKRLGFRKKQITSFSVHRSEEVAPLEARHLVKQGSSVSEGDSSMSGDSSSRSWSNSNLKQPTPDELASMSFIDGLGKGQMISRQGLASPYLGDIQLSLCDRRGNLEVEVIRARNLQSKTSKILPLTYVKLYLVKNRKCLLKAKTTLSNKRTLDPLFQQQLTFQEDYHGCILQSIVWGNFGKMDKKNFMGIAQISIDDLDLSDTVISWYKLFLPSSLQTLPSKSLRHTLLSNSTESFTNTNNS